MGDAEAGVALSVQRATRTRGQLVATVVVVAAVLVGGAYLERVGPARAPAAASTVARPSGAWFCPHGGGRGWEVTLEIANPGPAGVDVRVTHLSEGRPSDRDMLEIAPRTQVQLPFRAGDRASGSLVEFFDGWVAAGWVAHAGGADSGVAAEPCIDQAARRWYAPDGVTLQDHDTWIIAMNPFASTAVVSLSLYTGDGKVTTDDLTNVPIPPYRVRAFHVNRDAEGYPAVGTLVEVPGGRVAVASLGLSEDGGARSTVAQSEATGRAVLPLSSDQGRSDLLVMNTLERDADLAGSLAGRDASEALELLLPAIAEAPPRASSSVDYSLTAEGPTAVDLTLPGGVAAARRAFGISSDEGSTISANAAHQAWVLLPAIAGSPSKPGLVLTDLGDDPVEVTLSFLSAGSEPPPEPIVVSVPAGRSVNAPREFLDEKPRAAVLAVASAGTFVPAFASYSLGREGLATYAVSLGVPVPAAWEKLIA